MKITKVTKITKIIKNTNKNIKNYLIGSPLTQKFQVFQILTANDAYGLEKLSEKIIKRQNFESRLFFGSSFSRTAT